MSSAKMEIVIIYHKGHQMKVNMFDLLCPLAHSCFRGLLNCWAPSMENGFQVAKFSFEVPKTSKLFSLVPIGLIVIWGACIGLR